MDSHHLLFAGLPALPTAALRVTTKEPPGSTVSGRLSWVTTPAGCDRRALLPLCETLNGGERVRDKIDETTGRARKVARRLRGSLYSCTRRSWGARTAGGAQAGRDLCRRHCRLQSADGARRGRHARPAEGMPHHNRWADRVASRPDLQHRCIASPENATQQAAVASLRCSRCLMLPGTERPKDPFPHRKSLFVVVKPVELWATRQASSKRSGKSTGQLPAPTPQPDIRSCCPGRPAQCRIPGG